MIRLEGLEKTFDAQRAPVQVLRGVTLEVPKGEIFGIIGRSGAGKSTLARCVNLLERPTRGRVFVGDVELTALDEAALRAARRRIGMIFQHFNLLSSRTAFENAALPLELAGMAPGEIRDRVEPLLALVGLTAKRDRYPVELSGGEKQRVGIARALASRPEVLLCDEATSALDPETTGSILALLQRIRSELGLTILLITHEMGVIQAICDRVAVLDRGQIAELGTVFDVFTAPKSEVARAFVRDVLDLELPPWVREKLRLEAGPGARPVLRIVFTGPSAFSPIIAEVVRRFDVLLNIMQAHVDDIQGSPYGNMIVEALGPPEKIEEALAFIRGHGLQAEVLGHVE